ncbi:MAG: hypothetical protein CME71_10600 [Halobacteriovorax sp.]|nr:hypothetical protein [Halobacteriovorax sp.]
MAHGRANNSHSSHTSYAGFDQLDGRHPLQQALPQMVVTYKARSRKGAKIAYFNFALAKEMGLIDVDHPEQMNPALEKKLMETFSIIIINEFDELNKRKFPEKKSVPTAIWRLVIFSCNTLIKQVRRLEMVAVSGMANSKGGVAEFGMSLLVEVEQLACLLQRRFKESSLKAGTRLSLMAAAIANLMKVFRRHFSQKLCIRMATRQSGHSLF